MDSVAGTAPLQGRNEPEGPFVGQVTFTTTATSGAVNATRAPVSTFSIQAKGQAAAASSWTVILEASLNGTDYSPVLTHQTSTGDGTILSAADAPTRYFRMRCTALTLGSATGLQVTVLGL